MADGSSRSNYKSCDTFVVLPPGTANGCIVFGKNSDRPAVEVQEVVYLPSQNHPSGTKLKCTYIEIDQCEHTHAVILSKPAWMWGAEMGANEFGVCIGNEAVWTILNSDLDSNKALLGMDLLRLGLERGSSAREALEIITALLEKYGQGGPCSDVMPSLTYHNSFLIVDRKEAWVLETSGKLWAAECIENGPRNISNSLSIGTKIDLMSNNLKDYACKNKLWHPSQGDFNFSEVFGDGSGNDPRYRNGKKLLAKLSASGDFSEKHMMKVLRDIPSGICMCKGSTFVSTASQVSVLTPVTSSTSCYHFFTATPDPLRSVFKPFVFAPNVQFTEKTVSPTSVDSAGSVKAKTSLQKYVDCSHCLYQHHERKYSKLMADRQFHSKLHCLEDQYIEEVRKIVENYNTKSNDKTINIFNVVVDKEIGIYEEEM